MSLRHPSNASPLSPKYFSSFAKTSKNTARPRELSLRLLLVSPVLRILFFNFLDPHTRPLGPHRRHLCAAWHFWALLGTFCQTRKTFWAIIRVRSNPRNSTGPQQKATLGGLTSDGMGSIYTLSKAPGEYLGYKYFYLDNYVTLYIPTQ